MRKESVVSSLVARQISGLYSEVGSGFSNELHCLSLAGITLDPFFWQAFGWWRLP
ncbi:hypothetical protein JMJ77_0013540 [Colletotrichum scovillei]|uniref:Uncharacterized protein n=1 Tax=Colletotrichum scovillei TaxID=1209932 RepID=A0A9P7R5W9_9PEZI|nr:hypothetical protein JMJ77_0013540 [Colletotrichum scovillei]KAG7069842.1 hypothetical protein JMJ76_0003502 [Colletotrichum scovillei]KAG7073788.1 hypothetical protein JMJ78_0014755 [Colletotrichum scovillei]